MTLNSPRLRRLQSDLQALTALRNSAATFDFEILHRGEAGIPESYVLTFRGPSLERIDTPFDYEVRIRELHRVFLSMGPDYPRVMPTLRWMTPIFHPNISTNGSVCLGGYSTHWVPSLQIDQLCEMIWDILCFRNFNLESPFHKDAALWMEQQSTFRFPLDHRSLCNHRSPEASDSRAASELRHVESSIPISEGRNRDSSNARRCSVADIEFVEP